MSLLPPLQTGNLPAWLALANLQRCWFDCFHCKAESAAEFEQVGWLPSWEHHGDGTLAIRFHCEVCGGHWLERAADHLPGLQKLEARLRALEGDEEAQQLGTWRELGRENVAGYRLLMRHAESRPLGL